MFRTFINQNGNIEYIPINSFSQNTSLQPVSTNPYYQNMIPQSIYINNLEPDPYSNSSLIITTSDDENDYSFSAYPKPIFYNSTSYDVNNDPELIGVLNGLNIVNNYNPSMFIKYIEDLDHIRNTNWRKILPELASVL
jgi:hypothetical protein